MVKLSVIVPVYNVECYLRKSIESILNQTFQDFELILVNDGSLDGSGRIIDEYADKDDRILALHQNNGGVGNARNNGLKFAKGKYVSFIDPDDWIDENMFRECVSYAECNNLDIVACNIDSFHLDGTIVEHPVFFCGVMSAEEFIMHMFDKPRSILGTNCNKLFKRSLIFDYYNESLRICEDNMFLIQYCKNIKKGGFINKSFYHIFERENSATRAFPERLVEGLSTREKIVDIAFGINEKIGKVAEEDFLDSCILMLSSLDEAHIAEREIAKSVLNNYLKSNFFRVVTNEKINFKMRIKYVIRWFKNS